MGVAAQKVNQNLPNLGAEQKRGLFEALGVSVPGPETETRVWQIPANKKLSTL